MGISVFVSLFSTRLVLGALGASDFGLYNIVGGAIIMLGFLNDTMSNVTQRFMSYEEGAGNIEGEKRVFNVGIIIHTLIAFVTCCMLIVMMPLLFNGILNYDISRGFAAKIVYLSLIFSTFVTIINSPYEAVLNAHENMLFYSIVGIIESFLKLLVALVCIYSLFDKLIVYGVLMGAIPVFSLVVMRIYCHRHYKECVLSPYKYWDSSLAKKMATFSGWNFLTSISSILSNQGIGLILNHFYGTLLNAAYGIANQVNGQLTSFSGNMKKALNPVIVKSAGAQNDLIMNKATIAGCKYSTYLTLLFAIPFIMEMPFVLKVWLKEVPDWAVTFCRLQLVAGILIQMTNSASTAIYAQGNIKWYAIYKSIMNVLPAILTFFCFLWGGSPYLLYLPLIVVWGVGGDVVVIKYAEKLCSISMISYIREVFFPVVCVVLIMTLFGLLGIYWLNFGIIRFLICLLSTSVGMIISLKYIGMTKDEKKQIVTFIYKIL